eukprot:scaffold12879_cov50-Attheya_sp.AAC.3
MPLFLPFSDHDHSYCFLLTNESNKPIESYHCCGVPVELVSCFSNPSTNRSENLIRSGVVLYLPEIRSVLSAQHEK